MAVDAGGGRVRRSIAAVLIATSVPAAAHPMPDTQVLVGRDRARLGLLVRVPMADLLLALPPGAPRDPRVLMARGQPALRAYFAAHIRLFDASGRRLPVTIGPIELHAGADPGVGRYEELAVGAAADAVPAGALLLRYDAVLHRVANHRAWLRDGRGRLIGVARYDLAAKRAAPIRLPGGPIA